MNNRVNKILKNFSYTLSANIISAISSVLIVLILPKFMSLEKYSYWQFYTFVIQYASVLHLGWCDGIYLRLGGAEYKSLDKPILASQYWVSMLIQLILSILISIITVIFCDDPQKNWIISIAIFSNVIVIPKIMLSFILQCTNRIKNMARAILIEKLIYLILIIMFVFVFNIRSLGYLILCDFIGKIIAAVYLIACCKDIVFGKLINLKIAIREIYINMSIGIKLTIAFYAGSFIIGIVRLGIEQNWGIETFGKISLTLNVSNLLMILINSIGMIMFPLLRRVEKEKLPEMYSILRDFLMVVLLGMLIVYYPVSNLLGKWLPEYIDGLMYMGLLFPICIFESKMSMLINTYLKTLRKEKYILIANISTVGIAFISNIFIIYIFGNLVFAVLSILGLLILRCVLAEMLLTRYINIQVFKDIVLEILLTTIFVIGAWSVQGIRGLSMYVVGYLIYILSKRKDLIANVEKVKLLNI